MRFVSDTELATLTPAEQRDVASPDPDADGLATANSRRCRRARTSARVEARIGDARRRARAAARHEPARVPGLGRRHVGRLPRDERGLRPGVHRLARRGRDARRGRRARRRRCASQFIVDCQTHFVRDDYSAAAADRSRASSPSSTGTRTLPGAKASTRYKFENYVKEIFVDSDTKVALLSGSPFDDSEYLFLTNDQIAARARRGQQDRRLAPHARRTHRARPGTPGWLEEVDRVHRPI